MHSSQIFEQLGHLRERIGSLQTHVERLASDMRDLASAAKEAERALRLSPDIEQKVRELDLFMRRLKLYGGLSLILALSLLNGNKADAFPALLSLLKAIVKG